MNLFLYSHWTELPINTRHKLASIFGIIKRSSTVVADNKIQSDGYVVKEIEQALNIDALEKYLGSKETDMKVLWTKLIDKVEGKTPVGTVEIIPPLVPEVKLASVLPKKRGRPAKIK